MGNHISLSAYGYELFREAQRRTGLGSSNLVRMFIGLEGEPASTLRPGRPPRLTKRSGGLLRYSSDKLLDLIVAKKWSLGGLAVQAGLSHNAVWQITAGGHTPREATLEKICAVLGVSVDEVCL